MVFVLLNETNLTINLNHLVMVDWDFIDDSESDTPYTTAISFSDGSKVYITQNDAHDLWKVIEKYDSKIEVQNSLSPTLLSKPSKPGISCGKP